MVVIFTIFGEANGGKTLLIESAVVAAPQIAVATEDQLGSKRPKIIAFGHGMDIARQFAGGRIIFAAQVAYAADVRLRGGCRDAFRKNADPIVILARITGRAVATAESSIQQSH